MKRSAVVFAPHPDDETLGCGGTIARKRDAGADVSVVFLTDGAASHARLMESAELGAHRAQEAREACAALGVAPERVHLLGFPDGRLREHEEEAKGRIETLLRDLRPEEVFLPHHEEAPSDHHVAHRVVSSALAQAGLDPVRHEYAIWLWNHWPWVRGGRARYAVTSLFHLWSDFRSAVEIGTQHERKRAALACHRSQMTRLRDDPRWLTLRDVSGGAFLECFFQPVELFCTLSAERAAAR